MYNDIHLLRKKTGAPFSEQVGRPWSITHIDYFVECFYQYVVIVSKNDDFLQKKLCTFVRSAMVHPPDLLIFGEVPAYDTKYYIKTFRVTP